MDFAEIKDKNLTELKELLARERAALASLRFKAHSRELKEVHKIAQAKKTIARILTVISDKSKQK